MAKRRVHVPGLGRHIVIGACKLPAHAPHGFKLKDFMSVAPPAPGMCDYSAAAISVITAIEGNDTLGDCVEAEDAHYIGVETGNSGNGLFPYTAAQTIADYSAITGYNPRDPNTDQGSDPIATLNYRVAKGYADGSKDVGWALVDASNKNEVAYALAMFGNLKMWFGIPDSIVASMPTGSGFVWDVPAGAANQNNGHCFTGDTKVSLLDGREITLVDLAAGAAGDEFWVYSCDSAGNVVPGRGHSARKTRSDVELLKVTLDNGEEIRCTPDHRFLMRDGSYCEARRFQSGSSLMPLYRRVSATGYEEYMNPRTEGWRRTHWMTAFGANAPIARAARLSKLETAPINHKVVSVEPCGRADVYDITVDRYHNFALTSGVFVHNCIGACGFNVRQIQAVAVTVDGVLVMTWGMLGLITWAALAAWFVPSVGGGMAVRVTTDWINKNSGQAPSGLNLAALLTAFDTYFGGSVPIPSPAPPAPTPTPPSPTPPAPPSPTPTASPTLAQAQGWVVGGLNGGFRIMTRDQAIRDANAGLAANWPSSP